MTVEKPIWRQDFPYGGREIVVTRFPATWRLSFGAQEAEATTLVEAFEILIRKRAGNQEMKVVVAALAWDRDFGSNDAERGLPEQSVAAPPPAEEADEDVA
jgi:hypothetical protein